jgi:hypothetical protein
VGGVGRKGEIAGVIGNRGQGDGAEMAGGGIEDGRVNAFGATRAGVCAEVEALGGRVSGERQQHEEDEAGEEKQGIGGGLGYDYGFVFNRRFTPARRSRNQKGFNAKTRRRRGRKIFAKKQEIRKMQYRLTQPGGAATKGDFNAETRRRRGRKILAKKQEIRKMQCRFLGDR